jgi:hypothetical protein
MTGRAQPPSGKELLVSLLLLLAAGLTVLTCLIIAVSIAVGGR